MKCKNSLLTILSLSFDFTEATDASDSRNRGIFIIIQKNRKRQVQVDLSIGLND